MCIIYIMITVYNNISVKYLKSKDKQDAIYVHINRLSFILLYYFLCLHDDASPLPYYFLLLLLLLLFFPA